MNSTFGDEYMRHAKDSRIKGVLFADAYWETADGSQKHISICLSRNICIFLLLLLWTIPCLTQPDIVLPAIPHLPITVSKLLVVNLNIFRCCAIRVANRGITKPAGHGACGAAVDVFPQNIGSGDCGGCLGRLGRRPRACLPAR